MTLVPSARHVTASVLPPGLRDATVLTDLTAPTAVRFAPDGRIFVAEKRGTVKVFSDTTDTHPRVVIDLSSQVHDYGDRGLLGLAVAPDFAAHPAIYVSYTRDALPGGVAPTWNDDCPTPPGAETDGCVVTGRVSRLPLAGDAATGEQVLLTGWCQQFPSHSIGSLAFDRTGALIVGGGDGASYNGVDYGQFGATYSGDRANPCGDPPGGIGAALTAPSAEGGALRSQSLNRADSPAVLNGSLLRVDRLTGSALPDNPFGTSTDPNRARIVAAGLRNPFRFTIRPGTDEVWLGDVGWNLTEEIDRIASTTDGVVENFGWPCYEGPDPQAGYRAAGLTACQRLYSTPGSVTPPYSNFPHAAAVVPGDGCPAGGSSISGLAFNTGDKYPSVSRGALFFSDYSRNCIWAMAAGADGTPDPAAISVLASDAGGPVDLQMGPDDLLYYAGIADGAIHRIEPDLPSSGGSTTYVSSLPWTSMSNGWGPVERDRNVGDVPPGDGGPITINGTTYARGLGAHAISDVQLAIPSGCTTFTADVGLDDSSGVDGSVVFSVLVDGVPRLATPVLTGTSAAFRMDVPVGGGRQLALHVGDGSDGIDYDHANWGDAKLTCTTDTTPPPRTNQPPVPTIAAPTNTFTWQVGQQIAFAGSATDPESGTLATAQLTWRLLHHHCPDATCHTHFVQSWAGVASGSFAAGDIDYPGWYELTLTAVDPAGSSTTTSVRLDPKTVQLTFQTNPAGLKLAGLVVGSSGGTTPFTRTVIIGSANTVSAVSPQTFKGKTYRFMSWSDGGAQNHTIRAPSVPTTYVATYRK